MWRFLAGVASALLLCGAGVIWWTNGRGDAPLLPAAAPALAQATDVAADPSSPPAAEERTREEKRFDRYDKDRDQIITSDEYLLSRRKAFAKLDVNGDGRLGFEEWAKKTTDKFAKADADRSRTLSRKEFATTKVVRKAATRVKCAPAPRDEGEEN